MDDKYKPLDPSGIKTSSLRERPAKVDKEQFAKPCRPGMNMDEFAGSLPGILAAGDLKEVAKAVAEARQKDAPFVLAMGAHVIKVGLSPLIIHMMETGIITGLVLNGACLVHDFEIAATGNTSEDVAAALDDGSFGMTRETAEFLNNAAKRCLEEDIGLGRAVGEELLKADLPFKELSIPAAAARLEVPVTVHVAVGTDIIHMHPSADGAAIGKGSHRDFLLLARLVSGLSQGVYLNLGSAVILPEVFLKALSLARNLGHDVRSFTTVNMDFIQHYRPGVNVVDRPVRPGGKGYKLTGHHEIMFPLLAALIEEEQHKLR